MVEMIYVMVTGWRKHWDGVKRTYYTANLFKGNVPPQDGTKTLFIKIPSNEDARQGAWVGTVMNITHDAGKGRYDFDVCDLRAINWDDQFGKLSPGWYEIDANDISKDEIGKIIQAIDKKSVSQQTRVSKSGILTESDLVPPMFYRLMVTNNSDEFEALGAAALQMLGIHKLYTYDPSKQAGRSDGFFVFKDIAVIFDFTLDTNWRQRKKQQVSNYVNQLKSGTISIDNVSHDVNGKKKYVWIIVKGDGTKFIEQRDDVVIKQVDIRDILDLIVKRVLERMTEDQLAERLRSL
jgi:hypothetical protein